MLIQPLISVKYPRLIFFLLTHNHYDHLDASTIRKFPHKEAKVITPLKLSKYFTRYKDVNELDWYQQIKINEDLQITLLPAVHWSKRSLFDTNKTLWGNYLIEYKDKKFYLHVILVWEKFIRNLGINMVQ